MEAGGLLDRYKLLVSVGHDEYWTARQRKSVEAFADRGGNCAFFTGNTCFWQVQELQLYFARIKP